MSKLLYTTNEVMDAVKGGKIDGIVTNWGNPLQGFNDYMKFHTDTQFYTAAFFIVMNREKYQSLPTDVRRAVDEPATRQAAKPVSLSFQQPATIPTGRSRRGVQPLRQ